MKINLLGVSGSLRKNSTNTKLLKTIGVLGREHFNLEIFSDLDLLPPFSPDREVELQKSSKHLGDWRNHLQAADALIFACPEYGHGVPGVLKNALDWVVGSGELVDKPVGITNAYAIRSRGTFALRSLAETLRAMNAHVVEQRPLSPEDDPGIWSNGVREILESLCAVPRTRI
ncbi:NAD(P)H-dependent oxidoreductase [Leptospira fletcheri]|uniref:NAD(P)H-dependent oxidoreductase n=1 Tax=Leptospira fletcheri TaxID=2484981 RepID=A0A4R9GIR0_9LEPT|nr:NADPH-dependent FMN reductase [Leptospira fletcheri]TGK12509.1 NAD(P)H-dependent oxidoreductase [Leptospira fletcheri]